MIYEVRHNTAYRYASPVVRSQHLLHLGPRPVPLQTVLHHALLIEPAPSSRDDLIDYFGNPVTSLEIDVEHTDLVVHARSTIEVQAPPARLAAALSWDDLVSHVVDGSSGADPQVVEQSLPSSLTRACADITSYAQQSFRPGRPLYDAVADLTSRIHRDFTFDKAATDVSTPVAQVFRKRRGVCQDFAHVALACLRSLRIPACYVSGYILTRPPPGRARLQGADASHAWIAVYSPDAGWVGFDPTNNVRVREEHITVAHGRDFDDVSPVSGVILGGGEHTVDIWVDVAPIG